MMMMMMIIFTIMIVMMYGNCVGVDDDEDDDDDNDDSDNSHNGDDATSLEDQKRPTRGGQLVGCRLSECSLVGLFSVAPKPGRVCGLDVARVSSLGSWTPRLNRKGEEEGLHLALPMQHRNNTWMIFNHPPRHISTWWLLDLSFERAGEKKRKETCGAATAAVTLLDFLVTGAAEAAGPLPPPE